MCAGGQNVFPLNIRVFSSTLYFDASRPSPSQLPMTTAISPSVTPADPPETAVMTVWPTMGHTALGRL